MKCINNKTTHGQLNGLIEGQEYEIMEEKVLKMEYGKKYKKEVDIEMIKVNGKRYNKNRFN